MRSLVSFWAIALLFSSFLGHASGMRVPVDEIYRKTQFDVKAKLTKRDLVCIQDDVLNSFEAYLDDSVPFCSSLINIGQQTTVTTNYARTTEIILSTVTQTDNEIATVASNTVTTTITAAPLAPGALLRKRQTDGITPASIIISSCQAPSGLNATVISDASSACSCLFIPETTVTLPTTVTSTRLEYGTDYKLSTIISTVSSGQATVTVTVVPLVPSFSVPGFPPETGGGRSGLPGSTGLLSATSASPLPSVNTTSILPGSSGLPSFSVPGFPPETGGGGSGLPGSTGLLSATSISLPPSVNTTSILPGSSGLSLPTIVPTIVIPPAPLNSTISIGPTALVSASNSSLVSSSAFPSSTSVPNGCPAINGTTYIILGQTFIIVCQTTFLGPDQQGLNVDSFYACVDLCAATNVGFSQDRCYAASYVPNNGVGSDCFFRNQNSSREETFDPKVTSAILVNNTLDPNITVPIGGRSGVPAASSLFPSISANITSAPSDFPTFSANITASSGFLPISSNITSPSVTFPIVSASIASVPSGFPTNSPNITSFASAFPTISLNSSAIPSFGIGFPGDNRTLDASSGFGSTGFPSATANSSSCAGMTVTSTIAATTIFVTAGTS